MIRCLDQPEMLTHGSSSFNMDGSLSAIESPITIQWAS